MPHQGEKPKYAMYINIQHPKRMVVENLQGDTQKEKEHLTIETDTFAKKQMEKSNNTRG